MTTFSTNTTPLREAIDGKRSAFGLFVSELRTPWLGTMLDAAGYDFCVLDMEHGTFSISEISAMIVGFRGGHCTPIVRIPSIRRDCITPLLDLGIGGIMVPNVETADDVRACIETMKYRPIGSRGVSLSRPHTGFVPIDHNRFFMESNERNLLIVQIESPKAVENLDDILAVPGIDVAFVGCADLSFSMGIPNDPSSGPLREILELVLDKANRCGVHGGANVTGPDVIAALAPLGLHMITITTDTKGFLEGISRPLQSIKRSKMNRQ